MTYTKQKFESSENTDFFKVLRGRVNTYFELNDRSKYGGIGLYLKALFMLSLYIVPYLILIFGGVTNYMFSLLLWVLIGLGTSGIGFSIMHDANHNAYSRKNWINSFFGKSMNLIGANAEIWKVQHNRLHHTYTNVTGVDEDISTPIVLRFSPHEKKYWIHKFQFLYAWFFYGLLTLSWFTTKEFSQLFRYRKGGLIKTKKHFNKILRQLIVWKVIYYTYMLVIPMIVLPFPFWMTLISFLIMHFITGLILSIVFQTAHVMPLCSYPMPDDQGVIKQDWAIHEMLTTTNFAPKSRFFSWFIGGLNFQIEHHLFPNVSHVHYKSISSIVKQTAEEFGIPYNSEKNFALALVNHTRMLYHLGRV